MQLKWDWTGATLSDILDYQTVSILIVLIVVTASILGLHNYSEEYAIWIYLSSTGSESYSPQLKKMMV